MISEKLEKTLHATFTKTRERRHEILSVEHLLLELLENDAASTLLKMCLPDIRPLESSLKAYIEQTFTALVGEDPVDSTPSLAFQRVVQRAIMHTQVAKRGEVTGADMLLALFGEKDSHAVSFLHQQGVTRVDLIHHFTKICSPEMSFREELAKQPSIKVLSYSFKAKAVQDIFRLADEGKCTSEALETFFKTSQKS